MKNYCQERNGRRYFRMRVPQTLHSQLGTEIIYPIHFLDLQTAYRRCRLLGARLQQVFDQALSGIIRFEIDPVFKFSLKMIEEDRGEELNELKSNLGGKDWSNSPPSGSQEQHYVHLSKAQAGAWFEKIAELAAEEIAGG